jgi:hypothetical protein
VNVDSPRRSTAFSLIERGVPAISGKAIHKWIAFKKIVSEPEQTH